MADISCSREQPLRDTVTQVAVVILLVLSIAFCITTTAMFANQYYNLEDAVAYSEDSGFTCFIFARKNVLGDFGLGYKSYCEFVFYSHIIIAIAIAFMCYFIFNCFVRLWQFRYRALVFTVITIVTFLLSAIVSVIISVGVLRTCQALRDTGHFSCEEGSYFVYNSDTYSAMQGITACSWLETVTFGILATGTCVYVAMKVRRGAHYASID